MEKGMVILIISTMVSYIVWLIITIIDKKYFGNNELIRKRIRCVIKVIEIVMYIMIIGMVYLFLITIFILVFNLNLVLWGIFMNESVAQYLSMIGVLILATYRGNETIIYILMSLDKISEQRGTKVIIMVLCKALNFIRIKIVIYFMVIVANIVAFIDLKTDMNLNIIGMDTEMMLYVTITFIAIDCFIDKLKPEIDNYKKDINNIKSLFKDE